MFGKFPFGWSWFGFGQPQPEDEEEEEQPQPPAMVVGTLYLDSWPVTVFTRPQLLVLRGGRARAHGEARAVRKVTKGTGRDESAALIGSRATARGAGRAAACGRAMQLGSVGRSHARGGASVRGGRRQQLTLTCSQARPIGIRNPTEEEIVALLLALD